MLTKITCSESHPGIPIDRTDRERTPRSSSHDETSRRDVTYTWRDVVRCCSRRISIDDDVMLSGVINSFRRTTGVIYASPRRAREDPARGMIDTRGVGRRSGTEAEEATGKQRRWDGRRGVYSPTSSVRTPISRVVTTRRGTCRRRGHSTARLSPIISSHACDRVHLHARGNAAASRLKFRAAARLRISAAHEASHPLLHPVARSFKRRVARTAESAPFVPLRRAATGIHPRGIPSSLDASLTGRARVASSAPNYADTPGFTQSPVIMVGGVTRAGVKLVLAVGLISRIGARGRVESQNAIRVPR